MNMTLDYAISLLKSAEMGEIEMQEARAIVLHAAGLQVKKEPLLTATDKDGIYYYSACPNCNAWLARYYKPKACRCGQKLEWGGGE